MSRHLVSLHCKQAGSGSLPFGAVVLREISYRLPANQMSANHTFATSTERTLIADKFGSCITTVAYSYSKFFSIELSASEWSLLLLLFKLLKSVQWIHCVNFYASLKSELAANINFIRKHCLQYNLVFDKFIGEENIKCWNFSSILL